MKINISKEYLRFEKEKQEKRKIYDNLNMNVEQIEQIEAIDKKIFRNDINYNAHNIPLYSGDYEYEEKNMEQKSIVSHIKNIYEEMDYSLSGRYYWIDEISSDVLLNEIHKLNAFEIEVITLVAFDGYSKNEAAKKLNVLMIKCSTASKRYKIGLKTRFAHLKKVWKMNKIMSRKEVEYESGNICSLFF